MNNWDIGGARNIGAANDLGEGNDIVEANELKGRNLEITSTSTFTSDISDPKFYTQTQVESLLARKRISSDISTTLIGKSNKSTTYTKTYVDSLLTRKASSSEISTAIAGKANKSTTYSKTDVDTPLTAKQNTVTFIDPMNLGSPVACYPLLVGSNIIQAFLFNYR